ncbi:hypothetical protein BY996DRAFT_6598564 [Phakopsora pachyrhizi]|uniref:Uncharacterized protein n=1 Tax=Phakopsora pachyrhizi TaxID=170000 RepID=A0AAV0BLN2_PHAPC|nr:hypothetical protein BY996DRAFT_6598564 [Phakopsora pachyrhizi]CAH7687021.1 hypothetical protein PPACK8108_LOCUS21742 [Phakopsora pachyrhizi]
MTVTTKNKTAKAILKDIIRNNKDIDGLRNEINHQSSKKSQNSLIINNILRQHQQLIKSPQLNRISYQTPTTGNQIHHHPSQPLRATSLPSQTTLKAVLTPLSTRIRDVPCTISPRIKSGVTVDPKPLPDHNQPQCNVTIQALPPSEHPESYWSNTPGLSQPEHLPNHQSSSKLEIEPKDEDSEEEEDDDVLGNEELYSAQTHLSPKDEILPISGPLREAKTNEMARIIKEKALKFEEERHWLTSKLVKLTSSNQVLERGRM